MSQEMKRHSKEAYAANSRQGGTLMEYLAGYDIVEKVSHGMYRLTQHGWDYWNLHRPRDEAGPATPTRDDQEAETFVLQYNNSQRAV